MSEALAPGLRLKAEREKRGLSAMKAANQLHLDPWVIDALESGDYARIGPSVYAKGHLKKYAALLNIPASELLSDFDARHSGVSAPSKVPTGSTIDTPPLHSVSTRQMTGGVAVVAILGALMWFKPWQARGPAPSASARVESPAPQPAANSEPSSGEESSAAAVEPPPAAMRALPALAKNNDAAHAAPAPAGAPAVAIAQGTGGAALTQTVPTAGSGHARLRLSFTSDSFVDVRDAEGNKAYVGNGSANTVKTISGMAPMHVVLRSASGVQLEINGRAVAIGPQFFAGDVARFEAGADGVLRREAHHDAAAPAHPNG